MNHQVFLSEQYNNIRRIRYMIETEEFIQAYADTKEKEKIDELIKNLDADALRDWIKNSLALEVIPVSRLREIAKRKGIQKVWAYDRGELLYLIRAKEREHEKALQRGDGEGNTINS